MTDRLYVLAHNLTDSIRLGFLPAAASLGLTVTVLTDHPDEHSALDPAVEVLPCDVRDFHTVITRISTHHRPDAIVSNSDHLQTQTALAAAYFGLPGKPWQAALRAKDKAELRRYLATARADLVWSSELPPGCDPSELLEREVPFPCVLKPREGVASEDVVLVADPDELVSRCREIQARRPDASLVVEEYLPGGLRTLETLGDGRARHLLGGFRTELSPPPYFIETRMEFVPDPPAKEVEQVLAQLDALEVGFGICHTEYVVDEHGQARIIEVNYRAIGDHCDLLLAELLELPLFELVLRTHLGQPLPASLGGRRDGCARVEYPCAETAGTLVRAPDVTDRTIDGVRLTHRPLRDVGETHPVHRTNRDYLGVVTAWGTDQEAVDRVAAAFISSERWEIKPAVDVRPVDVREVEDTLLLRVLSTLVREDVLGLRTRGVLVDDADGPWLRLPADDTIDGGAAVLVPVEPDGFQATYAARLPLLRLEMARGRERPDLDTLEDVLAALAELADPVDRPGFGALAEECRQTLATMTLHEAERPTMTAHLTARHGEDPARWIGLAGGLGLDALAAVEDHPVYPTARGRAGLTEAQLRAHAPEFQQPFWLRWVLVPRESVRSSAASGPSLAGLPSPADIGFAEYAATHVAMPVHPLTVGAALEAALDEAGLRGRAVLVPQESVEVLPTLSMRTVARTDRPTDHLKLPLATSTLGLRNRRTIKPGTLVDGAAGQRLVESVLEREPRLRDRVLLADETAWAHAGHELLAVLLRRYPDGLDQSVVVPLAGLLAAAPDGRLVVDHLADRFHGGDPLALLDELLELLLDLQVTLFTYGVALESHQQNLSLVLDDGRPLRLLLKDNDGPRVNLQRLRERGLADPAFDDPRTYADDAALADVFTTITVHLCAGALAFGLARHGQAPLEDLLDLLLDRLSAALDRPGAAYLRARVLDAPELPVKAMLSAGTLLTKERSGALDVNKHYTTGPNYLRRVTR